MKQEYVVEVRRKDLTQYLPVHAASPEAAKSAALATEGVQAVQQVVNVTELRSNKKNAK